MPTRLILIRHGETAWNRRKRYCGSMDVALNAKGRLQVRRLRGRLKDEKIYRVYSSARKRALETARIIFGARCRIEVLPDLNEMHFGAIEGLTHDEAMKAHSAVYRAWIGDPFSANIPGGENVYDFRKRVTGAIKKIVAACSGRTAAVVCHGGSIGIYLSCVLKSKDFWRLIPKSASLTVIELWER